MATKTEIMSALTVMQRLPLDGILMVSAPQSLAAMVVRKTVKMAQTVFGIQKREGKKYGS